MGARGPGLQLPENGRGGSLKKGGRPRTGLTDPAPAGKNSPRQ